MSDRKQIPPLLLFRAIGLRLQGRIRFDKSIQGNTFKDGEIFTIFRKVVVSPGKGQPENPGAIFKVRFHFAKFGMKTNKLLSLIPIPFIIAQPGFRSKTWMFDRETGEFMGYYEWDTVEDAEKYWDSFPLRMMRRRAVQASLKREIIPL